MKKIMMTGSTSGLGQAIFHNLYATDETISFLLLGRRVECYKNSHSPERVKILPLDLSQPISEKDEATITHYNPDLFIHCAGGGPYGPFHKQKMKSHEWALRVNLLSFMHLNHILLKNPQRHIRQIIAVGSAIAENQADLGAASYSVAKHGLVGFFKNLIQEYSSELDVRLFSPGYMKTPMIPEKIAIELGQKCLNVDEVAQHFVRWMIDPEGVKHYTLNPSAE